MLKYIIGGIFTVIAIVAVLMFTGIIPGLRGGGKATLTKAQLEVWGTVDDEKIYTDLAGVFQNENPGVKVVYKKKAAETYEQELLRAFAAGVGPDAFQIHRTWLAKYPDILAPAPQDIFSFSEFRDTFASAAEKDLAVGGAIYGAPLYMDTLALYYQTDLFNSAGIVFPPSDWDEFADFSRRLTKRRQSGDVLISGAAIGGGKNVIASSDILALFMLQRGAPLVDANGKMSFKSSTGAGAQQGIAPEKALEFYTSFAKQAHQNYSWSGSGQEDSETAFAQNRVGMMIGYASARASLLKKSPKMKFAVAPLPQVKGSTFRKNYPDYWAFGVYKNTKNPRAAWEFIKFLTMPAQNEYYLASTGKPAAQKRLIANQQKDEKMKIFADQALSAVSWPQLNEKVVRDGFIEMIEAQITTDQPFHQTLQAAEAKMNALLRSRQ